MRSLLPLLLAACAFAAPTAPKKKPEPVKPLTPAQKADYAKVVQPMFDAQGKQIAFSKNKLTVSYINIPIMPHVVFSKNSGVQMIGLGGYVGYRIDSWTKSIEEKTENLSRVSSNFNLNQFRYGLRAEFAFKKLPNLFFNYDLSPLFEKNSSPNLAGFSFGIHLL